MRQTKYIVMLAKEGVTEIVNFMTHRTGFLIQGSGHVSHYSENAFCHIHIDIVSSDDNASFLCHC